MLVTNAGQLIRTKVDDIRVAGRNTQGVTLFRTEEDERVVSVARFAESVAADGEEPAATEDEDEEAVVLEPSAETEGDET